MKTESDWSVLPQDQVFGLSGSGRRELGGSISTLSARELELLVRMDGVTPLRQVRAAMQSVGDATFAALFKGLWQRGLLREGQAVPRVSETSAAAQQEPGQRRPDRPTEQHVLQVVDTEVWAR